jgi:hypothetical protein
VRVERRALVCLTLVACNPGLPSDDDTTTDEADLPSDQCGDGVAAPNELCLEETPLGELPAGFRLGDFDADGNLDVAAFELAGDSRELLMWLGDGEGGFTAQSILLANPSEANVHQWHVAELDGNPGTDVLGVHSSGVAFSYLNDGTGAFSSPVTSEFPTAMSGSFVIVHDLDLDGHADLLAEQGPNAWGIVMNAGDGTLAAAGGEISSDLPCYYTSHAAMPALSLFGGGLMIIDNECDPDQPPENRGLTIIWSNATTGEVTSFLGPSPGIDVRGAPAIGSFGDGGLQAIIWDLGGEQLRRYRAQASGEFEFEFATRLDEVCAPCGQPSSIPRVWASALTADTSDELIVAVDGAIHVGVEPFGNAPTWHTFPFDTTVLVLADFNNDGLVDILVPGEPGGAALLLSNP